MLQSFATLAIIRSDRLRQQKLITFLSHCSKLSNAYLSSFVFIFLVASGWASLIRLTCLVNIGDCVFFSRIYVTELNGEKNRNYSCVRRFIAVNQPIILFSHYCCICTYIHVRLFGIFYLFFFATE